MRPGPTLAGRLHTHMIRLTDADSAAQAARRLAELLDTHGEWFYAEGRDTAPSSLRRDEVGLSVAHGSLFLTLPTGRGVRVWRVAAWGREGRRLRLEASRRAGAVRAVLELTPRAAVSEAREALAEARRVSAARLASLACRAFTGFRLRSVKLSPGARRSEPGRFARAKFDTPRGTRVALTGPVTELAPSEVDAFLASALLWFLRLGEKVSGPRMSQPPTRLLLAVAENLSAATGERLALLRDELRRSITLCTVNDARQSLTPAAAPELESLLARRPRPLAPAREPAHSDAAREIVAHAPEAIDVVRSRHGETLRFRGLAFARVRRVAGREHVWFGVEPNARGEAPGRVRASRRQLLTDSNREEFFKLLRDLNEHRRPDPPDARHALYRAAPEAWLESLLRRDVTRLDPGLRLAPLHAQFRAPRSDEATAARPVDLLALRRDGRLVVIELKVSADASLPLQAADYCRRISSHHRAGHIRRARLFGDAEIADEPPLVYLVAPLLRFHHSFQTLARAITPEIEMYRFDLNEDWRAGVRVARRVRVV